MVAFIGALLFVISAAGCGLMLSTNIEVVRFYADLDGMSTVMTPAPSTVSFSQPRKTDILSPGQGSAVARPCLDKTTK
jgi:hypothetical protein